MLLLHVTHDLLKNEHASCNGLLWENCSLKPLQNDRFLKHSINRRTTATKDPPQKAIIQLSLTQSLDKVQ